MRRSLKSAAALAASAIAIVLFGPAPVAQAGASCSILGCSGTQNDSQYSITVYRHWCGGGNNADGTTTKPTCKSDGVAQQEATRAPGTGTSPNVDWDVFRVDAGWCYKVRFKSPYHTDFDHTYNMSATTSVALYVKVSDDWRAHVMSQKYGSCP